MSVLENLGYIKQASYYPCYHDNPLLVIQAAGAAAYPVLLGAVSLGCRDIIKMRAGLSPWHSRGMRALADKVIKPKDGFGAGQLLKYTIPIEKLLFFWFVVDLTTEFFARWQSNLFKLGACGAPPLDCNYSGINPAWIGTTTGNYYPIGYETASKVGMCSSVGPVGFIVPAGWYFSCFFDITPKPIHHGQAVSELKLRLRRNSPSPYEYEPTVTKPSWFGNGMTGKYMLNTQNKYNVEASYIWQAASDIDAYAASGSCAVVLSEFPIYNQGIIPVNCFGAPVPTATSPILGP